MKNIIIILIHVVLFSWMPSISTEANNEVFVLVLDPGHGGKDPGAIGKKGEEKKINLNVAKYAGEYIKKKHPDVKIIYTRSTDQFIGLNERANTANKNKANLFISIHTNAVKNRTIKGPEVFTFGVSKTKENFEVAKKENEVIYLEDNYKEKYEGFDPTLAESYIIFEFMQNVFAEQSIHFASLVQNRLTKCVSWKGRGIKQAEYLVLLKSTMPRILIELDFITNPDAEKFLLSEKGQKKYAQSICDAFTEYKSEYDRKNKVNTVIPSLTNQDNKKVYKVQILASSKKLPANSRQLKGYPAEFYIENNTYKYTYGESDDPDEISKIRKSLLNDFKDAFIICFENGKKVKY